MKRRSLLLAILALAVTCGSCGPKQESLSLLVWEGYADPSFVRAFEDAHHCKVVAA